MDGMPQPDTDRFPVVHVNGRAIGAGQTCYVIAEAGVNHDGDIDSALALVDAAVATGADAVKFQAFDAQTLAAAAAPAAEYQRQSAGRDQRGMLAALELDDSAFAAIRARCLGRGIEFLATPFSVPDVARLMSVGVCAMKIASTDLNNLPLLREVVATRLPLIVSTGAATRDEILTNVQRLQSLGARERLVVMHCVSSYPTPLDHANLRAIGTLRRAFNIPIGFSDHTTSLQTGGWAVAAGACVIEKHLTLDCAAAGPDHAMSLEPAQFSEYVTGIRLAETALGDGGLGMSEIERNVRAVARKSVVTAVDVNAGTPLMATMLTTKRPAGGIEPDRVDELLGRMLNRDAAADTVLTWDMVE